MGRTMKLGLIQVVAREGGSLLERQDCLLHLAEECFQKGAELVFFPEAYQHVKDRAIVMRPEDLRTAHKTYKEKCSALAKKYHAYLVPWDYDIDEEGRVYNMSYVLDRNGVQIGEYRKVHLTYTEQVKKLNEDNTFRGLTRGTDFPVFDLDFGKVGIMICYDNYFPESARCLALNGAELILYPLYGDTLNPQWEIKTRARAIDNGVYIASSRVDRTDCVFTGVIDPEGQIMTKLPTEKHGCFEIVEIDLSKRVKTHLTASPEITEDLQKMLSATRNPAAYKDILKEREIPTWDECYLGQKPEPQR